MELEVFEIFEKFSQQKTRKEKIEFLKETVQKIYRGLKLTEAKVYEMYPDLLPFLPEKITFIHSEELLAKYPQLNPKEREVFLLSRVEDKTYKEIAEITGLTVKAIERRMSKALKELREILGKHIKV